jgi:steroid delta-isomerase-like uncharacterized protein
MATATSEQTARDAVEAFFEAYRAHDVGRMVELCSEGADLRYVPVEMWARQRVVRADEKVVTVGRPIWTQLIDSFPDLTNQVHSIRADEAGNVAVEVTIGGTQAKDFGAIMNQGRRYDLPHLFLFHVDDEGLIDRIVAYWDTANWYTQLGKVQVD